MTVRVVIADDSPIFREVLREVVEAEGDIEVVGEAGDGAGVLRLVTLRKPDLLFLDIQMPALGGLEVIEEVMAGHPLPIVIVTSRPAGPGAALVFEATRRGALEVLEKGVIANRGVWLRGAVRELAKVPVVLHPKGKGRGNSGATIRATVAPVALGAVPRVIGVGASAGGPPAVAALLAALPKNSAASIAIVQHLSPGFAQGYAQFLQNNCALPVRLVTRPTAIEPGTVYVAPDGHHLLAEAGQWALGTTGPWPYRPSVDALFESLARVFGAATCVVVLSGMGRDGAEGAAAVARAGGTVLAQDQASSAVFGMPRVTAEVVRTARVLSLADIGTALSGQAR